jgi:UDP-glucose 4-epimerase
MTRTVFITGAAGFFGRHLVSAYVGAGARVGAIGHGARDVGASREIDGDVNEAGIVALADALGAPDTLIHCAGGGSVGAAARDPEADFRRTVVSSHDTLTFVRQRAPSARFILTSSAAVYGAANAPSLDEQRAVQPISVYGAHKAASEALALGARQAFGVDTVILRFFSIYGEGLRKQLLWELSQRLARGERKLLLFGAGDEQRDFLEVEDAVRLVMMASDPALRPPAVLNAGAGEPISVRRAAETLASAFGDAEIGFNGEIKPGDPFSLVADTTQLRAFGFAPRVSFDDGVRRFANWARNG